MSKQYNPYNGTNGNGYQPNPFPEGVTMTPPHGCGSLVHKYKNDLTSNTQSLDELAKSIADRGNDMQITHSKDGLKVFEVSKKLVRVIPK